MPDNIFEEEEINKDNLGELKEEIAARYSANQVEVKTESEEDKTLIETILKEAEKESTNEEVSTNNNNEIEVNNGFGGKFIKTSKGNINIKDLLKNQELIKETIKANEELNKVTALYEELKQNEQKYLTNKFEFQKQINDTFKGDKIFLDNKIQNDIFKYQILDKDLSDKLSHIKYINKELNILNDDRKNIKLEDLVAFKNKFENTFLKFDGQDKNSNSIKKYTQSNGLNYYTDINDKDKSKADWERDYNKLEEDLKNGKLNNEVFDKVINQLKEREIEIEAEYKDVNQINKMVASNIATNKDNISSKNIFEMTFKEYDPNTRTFKDKTINLLDDLESLNDKDSINKKLDHIMSSNMSFARQNKIDFISDYKKLLAEEAQARGKTFGDMNALDYISFYKLGLYAGDTFGSLKMLGTYLKENYQMNSKRQEILSKLEEFKIEKNSVLTKEKEIISKSEISQIELNELKELEKKWLELPGNEHKSIEQNASEFNEFLQKEKVGEAFKNSGLNLTAEDLSIVLSTNKLIENERKDLDEKLKDLGFDSTEIPTINNYSDLASFKNYKDVLNQVENVDLKQKVGDLITNFVNKKENLEKNSFIGMMSFFDSNMIDKEIEEIGLDQINKQKDLVEKTNSFFNSNDFQIYKEKYDKGELTDLEKKIFVDSLIDIKENIDLISKENNKFNPNNKELYSLIELYKNNNNINELSNETFNSLKEEQKETIAKYLKFDLDENKNIPEGFKLKDLDQLKNDIKALDNEIQERSYISDKINEIKTNVGDYFFIKENNESKKDVENQNKSILLTNNLSSDFTDKVAPNINSSDSIVNIDDKIKEINKNMFGSINGEHLNETNYDEQKLNKTLSNEINQLKEKTTSNLEELAKKIDRTENLSNLEKGQMFKDTVEQSFNEIGKQNESGKVLLGLFKNSVAGLKKEDLTTENIMKNWINSGNVNFELGIKNILETFIFNKQEVKLMFDDMKKEGYIPNYVNPEHFLGKDGIESDAFKKYQKSFDDLQKYIKDNNIPEGMIKVDELNNELSKLSNQNKVKDFGKEMELLRDKFLKSQYPNFDEMNEIDKQKLKNENEIFIDVSGMNKNMRLKESYKKELESALLRDPNFNSKSLILDSSEFNKETQEIINKTEITKILSQEELERIEQRVKKEKEKKEIEKERELRKKLEDNNKLENENSGVEISGR